MSRFTALVSAVLDAFVTKSANAAKRLAPHAKAYLRLLSRLVVFALIPPFLLLPLVFFGGTARDVGVLIVAILWSVITILLTLAASPLGLVIDALRGGIAGAGERYVRFAGNILFAEYSLAFLLLVIPLRNNLAGIPLLFVTFTLLMLGGVLSKRLMMRFALVVLPILLLSFFSPKIHSALNSWFGVMEERVAEGVVGGGEEPTNDGAPADNFRVWGGVHSTSPQPQVEYYTLTPSKWTEIVLPYGVRYRMHPVNPDETAVLEADGMFFETTGRNGPWVPVALNTPVPEPLPALIRLKAKRGQVIFKVVTWGRGR